ncbi:MAG: hypothetical protein ACI8VT_003109 [Saprospiraceae bacterium]|jgi:hypothetical protein
MGSKKNKSPLRDLMYDLQNSVIQKDDMSQMFGGTNNHNNHDNSGIGDDVPQ